MKSLSFMLLAFVVALNGVKANYINHQNSVPSIPSTLTVNHNSVQNIPHYGSIIPAQLPYENAPIIPVDLNSKSNQNIPLTSLVPAHLYYSRPPSKMPASIYCLSSQVYGAELPSNQINYSRLQIPSVYNKITAPPVNDGQSASY